MGVIKISKIHTNKNIEGVLMRHVINSLVDHSKLITFKSALAHYDPFFKGDKQSDALICLQNILDILHIGTKLPNCNTSVIKKLIIYKTKTFKHCTLCNTIKTSVSHSQDFLKAAPSNTVNYNIPELFQQSLSAQVSEICFNCKKYTKHITLTQFLKPPKILILIIDRYDIRYPYQKNNSNVIINQNFMLNEYHYDFLGAIFHHGVSADKGHYTCCVRYSENTIFNIDDEIVKIVNNSFSAEISNSIYILIYIRK